MTLLTGIVLSPSGTPVTGTLYLQLSQNANLLAGPCGGPAAVAASPPYIFNLVGGSIVGPGIGPFQVNGADCLTPPGLTYRMTVTGTSGGTVLEKDVLISGPSVDLGTLVAVAPPGPIAPSQLAGDVIGAPTFNTVIRIQSRYVSTIAPSDQQVLAWNQGAGWWEPKTVALSGAGVATRVAYWSSAGVLTSDANLFWDPAFVGLGIGLGGVAPGATIHASKKNNSPSPDGTATPNDAMVMLDSHNHAPGQAASTVYRSEALAGAALSLGQLLGWVGFRGGTGSSVYGAADTGFIAARATEAFSPTNQGTKLEFSTTPIGSSARALAVTIGGTSPLVVNGTIEIAAGSGGGVKFQDGTTQITAAPASPSSLTTTDDNATATTLYPLIQLGGANPVKTSSAGLTYIPSTGRLGALVMSAVTGTFATLNFTGSLNGPALGPSLVYITPFPGGGPPAFRALVAGDLPGGTGVTGSGTATQAAFWSGATALSGDNAFFWDNTNKRLGIGTTTPSSPLTVNGTIEIKAGSGGVIKFADGTTQATAATGGGGGGSVTNVSAGTGITLTPNPIVTSGTVALTVPVVPASGGTGTTTVFTTGSVVFAGPSGVYAQDNANLFWDDTNNRLGIGTAAPTSPLTVAGTIEIKSGSGGLVKFADGTTQATAATGGGGTVTGTGTATQLAFWTSATAISSDSGAVWDNTNKALLIGNPLAAAPTAGTGLEVSGADGAVGRIEVTSYGVPTAVTGRRANGTAASRTAVAANDVLAQFTAIGYTSAAAFSSVCADIRIVASEAYTSSAQGGYIVFRTSLIGTTVPVEKMRLLDNGNLGIGTTPSERLHTFGASNVYNLIESSAATGVAVATAYKTGNRRWEIGQAPGIGDNSFTIYDATQPAVRFKIDTAGAITANGSITAGSFSGPGTGLTGTAGSLTAGAATYSFAVPQNAQAGAYTLVSADRGKHILAGAGVTVPASVFNIGELVTIYNNTASAITITQGASVTMYLAGTATTGARTLAGQGIATVLCVAGNTFVISGGGLT